MLATTPGIFWYASEGMDLVADLLEKAKSWQEAQIALRLSKFDPRITLTKDGRQEHQLTLLDLAEHYGEPVNTKEERTIVLRHFTQDIERLIGRTLRVLDS